MAYEAECFFSAAVVVVAAAVAFFSYPKPSERNGNETRNGERIEEEKRSQEGTKISLFHRSDYH